MNEQLAEALKGLSQMSTLIPQRLSQLTYETTDIQEVVTDLIHRIETRKEQVENILEQVQLSINELPEIIQTQQTQLQDELTSLGQSLENWKTAIEQNSGELGQEFQAVEAQVVALKDQLEAGQISTKESGSTVQEGLGQLQTQVISGQEQLEIALNKIQQEIVKLQEHLQTAQVSVGEQVSTLSTELERSQQEVITQIQELIQTHFTTLSGDFESKLDQIGTDVIQTEVAGLLDQTEVKIAQELKPLVERIVDELGREIREAIRDNLGGKTEQMEGDRINLRGLFNQIDDLIDPLKDGAMELSNMMTDMGIPMEAQMLVMANPMVLQAAVTYSVGKRIASSVSDISLSDIDPSRLWS